MLGRIAKEAEYQVCRECPASIAAIHKFLRKALPNASYTAFAVLDNVSSPAHRDLQNEAVISHVMPLSSVTDGQIWAQHPLGKVFRHPGGVCTAGSLLPVHKGPVTLDAASNFHATEPWDGDRVVVSCYTLRGAANLKADEQESLLDTLFPLPLQVGDCARPGPVDYAATRAATGLQPKASKTVPLAPDRRGPRPCK